MSHPSPDKADLSKKIIANIKTKNQIIRHDTPGIADGIIHFDWYFPNLYLNGNVDKDEDAGVNIIPGSIIYDQALINQLILDKEYYLDYLDLTGKYFCSIGIDFTQQDASRDHVDYATAQGYKVRLNKIIESYKILMRGCNEYIGVYRERDQVPYDLRYIYDFYQDLQKRYKRIICAFKKDSNKFNERSANHQYGLYSLANCFEDDYRNKKKGRHINAIQSRQIYQDVFNNQRAPHRIIEQEIDREARLQEEAGPAAHRPASARAPAPLSPPPPLAPASSTAPSFAIRPAPPFAPRPAPPASPLLPPARARPDPLLAGSSSKNTLMRIKTVGDEIREPGRVTQNAKVTSTGRVAIPATIIKPIVSSQLYGVENFWASHERPSDQYRRGNDYLVLNQNIRDLNYDKYTQAIEKTMAQVISDCQKHLDMTKDEVIQAITLAKEYGGLGNVAEEALLRDPLLNDVAGVENRKAMLNKFRQFSFLVQKSNERNEIYSGRKGGKLVGLRLTFVSEKAISLWQENSRAIEARDDGLGRGGRAGGGRVGRSGGGAGGGPRR